MIDSMREEIEIMMSGHFVPYHKLCVMVVIVVSILFSFLLCNPKIYDGQIAVIDLDRSHYSTQLIERINASSYIEVREVVNVPVNPEKLMGHDRNLGVLYIPKGLTIFYKGIMPSEKVLDFPVDCNTLTGSVNL